MYSVYNIAEAIVRREGGFVDDPDDPGGVTNFGVTLQTLKGLGVDIDGNGHVDISDLKAMNKSDAVEIFIRHYFNRPKLDQLPSALQPSVFDMQVNAGSNAIRILQRLLGHFGQRPEDDGVIGPSTIDAVYRALDLAPDHLVDAYGIARRNYYYHLGDKRPASRKYARRKDGGKGGWILRAEEFIAERFHFTRAQHDRRVAAWG